MFKKVVCYLYLFLLPSSVVLCGDTEPFEIENYSVTTWNIFSGLSSDSIITIFQDSKKYLWIGTFDGLLRYNGKEFLCFDETNSPGFTAHSAHVLVEAEDGTLWIGTENEGLVRYRNGVFLTFTSVDGLLSNSVLSLAYDPRGRLWIGTSQGLMYYDNGVFYKPEYSGLDPFSGRPVTELVYQNNGGLLAAGETGLYTNSDSEPVLVPGTAEIRISASAVDKNGTVWYGTRDGRLFFRRGNSFTERVVAGMENTSVRSIYIGGFSGNLWVAGGGGLWTVGDGGFGRVSHLSPDHSVLKYIPKTVLEDHEGSIWIGTRTGGISQLSPSVFTNYNKDDGLTDVTVNNVAMDRENRFWIAADDGLYCLQDGNFVQNDLTDLLRGIRVKHVFPHESELYISTISPLGAVVYSQGTVRYLNEDTGLPSNVIKKVIVDSRDAVWISTSEGIVTMKPDGELVIRNKKNGFPGDEIYDIFEDSTGRIWAATVRNGLFRFDLNGGFVRFFDEDGLSGEMIFSVYEDREGRFWLSTAVGVFLIDQDDNLYPLRYDDGLPYLYVYNALPVGPDLWFSSVRGVARASLEEAVQTALGRRDRFALESYTFADGLSASPNALSWLFPDPEGRIWVPTHKGLSVLDTGKEVHSGKMWPLHIEQMIFDEAVTELSSPGAAAKGTVERAGFQFSALTFTDQHRARYSYFLQGYDTVWSEPSKGAEGVYTKLKPGRYTFRVRVYDEQGAWKGEDAVRFSIAPRFYQTLLFKLGVFLLITAGCAVLLYWRFNRMRRQNMKLEEEIGNRTREVESAHQEQLDLLADISHEIRTPLTVIEYNIANVISGKLGSRVDKNHPAFAAVRRNGNRILVIVNNLLQFFKLRYDESSYPLQPLNPDPLLRRYVDELRPVAEAKEIQITYTMTGRGRCLINAHPSLFDSVMLNLISNAIAGNCRGGRIEVVLDTGTGETCRIKVDDNGTGLTREELDLIFVPYAQTGSRRSGTGLGLGIVRKAVSRIGGMLDVKSTKGKGTVFTVSFPKLHRSGEPVCSDDSGMAASYASSLDHETNSGALTGEAENGSRKPVVLVVEDNKDLQMIIKEELSKEFTVIIKADGTAGLSYLQENPAPGAVISDIMMPELNGKGFYLRVRNIPEMKNVPFLFLTARASVEEAVEALRDGAADYLFKPFSPELLLYKIKNLTALQRNSAEAAKQQIGNRVMQIFEQDDDPEKREQRITIKEIQDRYSLTDRESEILHHMLNGTRDKEIARILDCAVSTISNTASRIYRKTGCGSRVELLSKFFG